ncbi:MAG: hypothetical protein HC813_03650 [Planctomycetes bacterium]|nr:hypothetical protein [Planctomycetota bacterium]
MEADGKDPRLLFSSWNEPDYEFSPDGRFVAYALEDNDFNRDIWIRAVDGSVPPCNVSRHPDWETGPTWSPDGRMLAFTGERSDRESDIHYVWLRRADDDASRRDRTLEKALEKMKERAPPEKPKKAEPKAPVAVEIDFEGIADRVRRIPLPDVQERALLWSPDSKKLAFVATVDGREGLYTVEPPDEVKPKLLVASRGEQARWLSEGNQIVWRRAGKPESISASGQAKSFPFRVLHEFDLRARHRAAYDLAWRTMRDWWYDGDFGGRDWNAIGAKYRDLAAASLTTRELTQVASSCWGS